MVKDQRNEDGLSKNLQYPATVTNRLPREKLCGDLQEIVDQQDTLLDQMYDGELGDSTDTGVRYAAYASRLRTIMMSAHRYVAYTSDIGESFRPIAHPGIVRTAYGVSWAYLIGDVGYEGYKAYNRNLKLLEPKNEEHVRAITKIGPGKDGAVTDPLHIPAIEDWKSVVAQRAVFQGVASMGLPAFTIHSIVKYSGRALKSAANTTLRTWGPIGLGLAAVPALPYMFDEPVEHAVEWAFYNAFKTIGGEKAVEPRHNLGHAHSSSQDLKQLKLVEKKQQ